MADETDSDFGYLVALLGRRTRSRPVTMSDEELLFIHQLFGEPRPRLKFGAGALFDNPAEDPAPGGDHRG